MAGETGWKCPVCGKGNAPWSATCGHCEGGSSGQAVVGVDVSGADKWVGAYGVGNPDGSVTIVRVEPL